MKKVVILSLVLIAVPLCVSAASDGPEAVAPEVTLSEIVETEAPPAISTEETVVLEDLLVPEPVYAACIDSGVLCYQIDCTCEQCVCAGTCLYCP